ncbi:uncharacterized protein EI97DRAFT_437422 [Westerdykella ornata]|uniref:Pathway-specific nitrogen regulator n=1 Tax=Westerdykella ornata TaxID=318751 RepID=A0A6A6J5H1_WESOR|nr:uncharacterized protein EI97DRAFT_437422 [Westerdykella ornata]KAF2271840.1 hypothetical protein EI97DRAFT_437422 [Westerdykella ornata]
MAAIQQSTTPCATPFATYGSDEEVRFLVQQSEEDAVQEISGHDIGPPDELIPSIEEDDRHVLDSYDASFYSARPPASERIRTTSGMTSTSFISSLPSELSIRSQPTVPVQYGYDGATTRIKQRPLFRNPASVRAMQMSSPPPLPGFEGPHARVKGAYQFTTPSRKGRSETPMSTSGSRKSGSYRGSIHRASHDPPAPGPTATATPQQHLPLVLLHVTILPMQVPYPPDLMSKVMPRWLVENYKLLEGKLQDVVLMQRGLLIAHPNEEYDLLEERILESLELRTPRLLKCGHFLGSGSDRSDISSGDENASDADYEPGRGSSMSGGTMTAEDEDDPRYSDAGSDCMDVCADCHRQVKRPGQGVGLGKKRWDLKVYAANGLMRAGAWSAAWKEMERCDVEISPWIPEDVRSAVQKRVEEEQEKLQQRLLYEAEVQRLVDQETARLEELGLRTDAKALKNEDQQVIRAAGEAELRGQAEKEHDMKQLVEEMLARKMEEIKEVMRLELGDRLEANSSAVAERFGSLEKGLKGLQQSIAVWVPPIQPRPSTPCQPSLLDNTIVRIHNAEVPRHPRGVKIPLGVLLKNYLLILAKDEKNVALFVLLMLLVYLVLHGGSAPVTYQPSVQVHSLDQEQTTTLASVYTMTSTAIAPEFSMATTTATITATTTATVTKVEYLMESESSAGPTQDTNMTSVQVRGFDEDTRSQRVVDPLHETKASSVVETVREDEGIELHAPEDERPPRTSSAFQATVIVGAANSVVAPTALKGTRSFEITSATPDANTDGTVSPSTPHKAFQLQGPAAPYCTWHNGSPLIASRISTDADSCLA